LLYECSLCRSTFCCFNWSWDSSIDWSTWHLILHLLHLLHLHHLLHWIELRVS
jgi:hypothetical protein